MQQQQQMEDFDISSIPAEFNPLVSTFDSAMMNKSNAGDERLFVKFFTRAVLHPAKSTQEGRPIFEDQDFIEIRTPGSQLVSVIAPVKRYMDRFGDKYNKWKAGQAEAMVGTPLENLPTLFNKPSMVAELQAINIRTVEQLVNVPDNVKQRIMGGFELCRRAAEWLESVNGADAKIAKMQEENAALQQQLNFLQQQVSSMANNKASAKAKE